MLTFSVPGPRVEFVVVTVIDRLRRTGWPAASCRLLVTGNVDRRVGARGESARTASTSAAAVKFAGSVRLTVPLCGDVGPVVDVDREVDRLAHRRSWPSAAERPIRRAAGAVFSSQLSYSSHLPKRWKRPSAGATRRTVSSV